jgi:hypothetical protein
MPARGQVTAEPGRTRIDGSLAREALLPAAASSRGRHSRWFAVPIGGYWHDHGGFPAAFVARRIVVQRDIV